MDKFSLMRKFLGNFIKWPNLGTRDAPYTFPSGNYDLFIMCGRGVSGALRPHHLALTSTHL